MIRIAGLVPESYVDGAGIRFAVFMQGCRQRCAGCHNPQTHDLNGGTLFDTCEIIAQFKDRTLLDVITLTGGEPLLQPDAARELALIAKMFGLNVWCYTGYTFENLPHDAAPLLEFVDVLVDGEFILAQRDLDLRFRGSRNQRLIDVPESRRHRKTILFREE